MKTIGVILVVLVMVLFAGCCFLNWLRPVADPVKKTAEPSNAEFLLKNLALGMRIYSVKHGGGGHKSFASSLEAVKPFIMEKAYPALPGPNQSSYLGWKVRLEENPAGDGFKTNFRLIAYPAEGYEGQTICVDKSETVSPYIKQ